MSVDLSNVTAGGSLAISVSGTDYLSRSSKAGVMPGVLPATDLQKDVAAGRETVSGALKRVSQNTLDEIEKALKVASPSASLTTYALGSSWKSSAGTFFSLEA